MSAWKFDLKRLRTSELLYLFTNSDALLDALVTDDELDISENEIVDALVEVANEVDRRFPIPPGETP